MEVTMPTVQPIPSAAVAARLAVVMEHVRLENAHDISGLMDTFGPDAFYDVPAVGAHLAGREAVRDFYTRQFQAAPDLHIEVNTVHHGAESIILEVTISGTHTGAEWIGLPAKGKAFSYPLCAVYIFGPDDKLAGERIYFDFRSIVNQIQ